MILVDAWEIYWAINPINKARKLHLVAIKIPEKQIFPHSTDYDAAWSIRGYSFSPSWMLPSHLRLRQRNFIEKTFWCGCSPVNLLPIFRTPFLRTPMEDCFCSLQVPIKIADVTNSFYLYRQFWKLRINEWFTVNKWFLNTDKTI